VVLKIPEEVALHLIGPSKVKKETIMTIINSTVAEYVRKVSPYLLFYNSLNLNVKLLVMLPRGYFIWDSVLCGAANFFLGGDKKQRN
jgi:hypothetical protein